MPVLLSERLPLPSLRSYIVLSIVFFVSGLLQARNQTSGPLIGENESFGGDSELKQHSSTILGQIAKDRFFAWVSIIGMKILWEFYNIINKTLL